MAMAIAWLHVYVRCCLFMQCRFYSFLSSGKAFFGLKELPASSEGESTWCGSPQGHKAGLCQRSGLHFNFCTGVF